MVKYLFLCLFLFAYASASAQTSNTLSPVADAFVRNGSYAGVNYGSDTSLNIKGSTSTGFSRKSYLKFSLNSLSTISAAKIRIYGKNTDNTSGTVVSICGAGADSWTESGISWSNSLASSTNILSTITVNNQAKYYEFDVSEFVKAQFAGDKTVSFLIQDISNQNRNLLFNSKENKINKPQLVITSESVTPSTALLFVENPDKFPANDQFVFSRIQNPWTRDTVYAANHDSLKMRIHNKGINSLVIKSLVLSNITGWKIDKIKGVKYVAGSSLPISLSSGTFVDLIIKFTAVNQATRVKVLHDTLTIVSNDGRSARKAVLLSGLWQNKGEGSNEPYAQEIINAFGFKTSTGTAAVQSL